MDRLDLQDEILDESYDHVGEGVFQIKLFKWLAIVSAIIFPAMIYLKILSKWNYFQLLRLRYSQWLTVQHLKHYTLWQLCNSL